MIHAVQTSNFTTEGTQIFSVATARIRSTREGNVFSLSNKGEGEGGSHGLWSQVPSLVSGSRSFPRGGVPQSMVPGLFHTVGTRR